MNKAIEGKSRGLSSKAILAVSLVLLALGAMGKAIEVWVVDMALSSPFSMTVAGVALFLEGIGAVSYPPLCFLLVRWVQKGKDVEHLIIPSLLLGLAAEMPYNILASGKIADMNTRNPVFALFLSIVALCFYRRSSKDGWKSVAVFIIVTSAALAWVAILSVVGGAVFVLLCAVLWLMGRKMIFAPLWITLILAVASTFSPIFFLSPLGCILIYFHNGGEGE